MTNRALLDLACHPPTYEQGREAALELVGRDCSDIQDQIREALDTCLAAREFPEFLPVLVATLNDRGLRDHYLSAFLDRGGQCSADLNGGFLRAFSLCQDRERFRQAIFTPHWEASSPSTGALYEVHAGLRDLDLSVDDVAQWAAAEKEESRRRCAVELLMALMRSQLEEDLSVWVFHGEGAQFAGGVFAGVTSAEEWIADHALTGVLTRYPLDQGVWDWAVEAEYFTPRQLEHSAPRFVGGFTSALQEHIHYEGGVRL